MIEDICNTQEHYNAPGIYAAILQRQIPYLLFIYVNVLLNRIVSRVVD